MENIDSTSYSAGMISFTFLHKYPAKSTIGIGPMFRPDVVRSGRGDSLLGEIWWFESNTGVGDSTQARDVI